MKKKLKRLGFKEDLKGFKYILYIVKKLKRYKRKQEKIVWMDLYGKAGRKYYKEASAILKSIRYSMKLVKIEEKPSEFMLNLAFKRRA